MTSSSSGRSRRPEPFVKKRLRVSRLLRLRGIGLMTACAEQAAADYQARESDRQVQDVVPINPGGDGQQRPVAHKAQHGDYQHCAADRDVHSLISCRGQCERSHQPQQPQEDIYAVVESVRLEYSEDRMVRHLGVIGEACQNEPENPKNYHEESEEYRIRLVHRPGSRLALDLDPEFLFRTN